MKIIVSETAKEVLADQFAKVATATPYPIAKIVFVDAMEYDDIQESYWTIAFFDGRQFPVSWRVASEEFQFVVEPDSMPPAVNTIYFDSRNGVKVLATFDA